MEVAKIRKILKKMHFKDKIDLFLTFKFINFLVRTLQCAETRVLYFFAHENMKKPPSKVLRIYFRKMGEVCSDMKININVTFLMFPTYSLYKYCPNIYPASLYYSTKVSSIWHSELAPKVWIFRRFFSCNKHELLLRIRNNLDLDTQTWFFDSFSKSGLLEGDLFPVTLDRYDLTEKSKSVLTIL